MTDQIYSLTLYGVIDHDRKIAAINLLRTLHRGIRGYTLGLAEAKSAIDNLLAGKPICFDDIPYDTYCLAIAAAESKFTTSRATTNLTYL